MSVTKTTETKLNNLIRRRVVELFRLFINDPDHGLELSDHIKNRLRAPAKHLVALKDLKRRHS